MNIKIGDKVRTTTRNHIITLTIMNISIMTGELSSVWIELEHRTITPPMNIPLSPRTEESQVITVLYEQLKEWMDRTQWEKVSA